MPASRCEGRAAVGTTGEVLRGERASSSSRATTTPSSTVYAEDGSVASLTDEGRATIEILGLNRAQLLGSRLEALEEVRAEWEYVGEGVTAKGGLDSIAFDHLFDRARPFAALRRQFLNTWMQRRRAEFDAALEATPEGPSSVAEVAGNLPTVTAADRNRVKGSFDAAQRAQDTYTLEGDTNAGEDYFRRTRRIERIEVRNFVALGDVDLRPATLASSTATAPWLMLLGENGCGKSSLLQAVALALMGEAQRTALGLDAREYVRNGTLSGVVRVHLAGSLEPIELRFSRRSGLFQGGVEPKVIVLAYGAIARPLRVAASRRRRRRPWPASNFTPSRRSATRRTGCSASTTRRSRRSRARSRAFMGLEADDRFVRNRRAGRVDVEAFGTGVPLEHLSDGYQSVVALATDLMISLLQQRPSVVAAEGTVPVDELGAHLHPRWRMRIVSSLRQVFPRVQFLCSTHDPLALRGLARRAGRVAVKRDADGEVVTVTDLPSVAGLRVDQLLTSEHALAQHDRPGFSPTRCSGRVLPPGRRSRIPRLPTGAASRVLGPARLAGVRRRHETRADRARGGRRLPREDRRARRPHRTARAPGVDEEADQCDLGEGERGAGGPMIRVKLPGAPQELLDKGAVELARRARPLRRPGTRARRSRSPPTSSTSSRTR